RGRDCRPGRLGSDSGNTGAAPGVAEGSPAGGRPVGVDQPGAPGSGEEPGRAPRGAGDVGRAGQCSGPAAGGAASASPTVTGGAGGGERGASVAAGPAAAPGRLLAQ